ncbi:hypothetical protein HMJ29_20120 [Hymenobacter taeanensis]|uniref:Glycoside hydrolase family 2 catalytic domain-containing protein n=1 Tax=Hymenobacter taeanensis TaxID=2735321 RepID=A0A6M6BMM6_9BACT|nr:MULTISPECIES: glycoside hydrolase family 2 TIM barrel-domain containing protein [Hymenobacter]QJX49088.1 hypothetical protein HMJ29_20120 [Hymenobacter taeanensis]UOQ81390.1 hypothetical protein MUN83_00895 [Hymenobacter sp. 5414T-23]
MIFWTSDLVKGLQRWLLAGVISSCATVLVGACTPQQEENPPAQIPAGVVPVHLVHTAQGYLLQRAGKPYFVKGGAGLEHYDKLKAAGANSVRLWSGDYADDRLDEANRQGLTVLLGLWMVHESKKFDYYNNGEVERQKARLRQQVLRYRHHPALLGWSVGNEINYESANPQLYRAINDVARMIHELDPYHPVTTTLTSTLENLNRVKRLCPDLDFISINAFGNLISLPQRLKAQDWEGPYLVTEFGARGYWESPKTVWGASKEQTSTQKAQFTRERYKRSILGNPRECLGSYAFYWGNKFEYTATWFSLFTPTGEKTATVDALQELWTGTPPINLSPEIQEIRRNGRLAYSEQLRPNAEYGFELVASDPENDLLQATWQVAPEVKFEKEGETVPIEHCILKARGLKVILKTPEKIGAYRLSATVRDGKGSAATASLPFLVK